MSRQAGAARTLGLLPDDVALAGLHSTDYYTITLWTMVIMKTHVVVPPPNSVVDNPGGDMVGVPFT